MRAWLLALSVVALALAALPRTAADSRVGGGCSSASGLAVVVAGSSLTLGGSDVSVLPGATCDLSGKTVHGSIGVMQGGTLIASGATISGGIAAANPLSIALNGATLGGNLAVAAAAGGVTLNGDTVHGNLTLSDNLATTVLTGTTVGGAAAIVQNRGTVIVAGDNVSGSYTCAGTACPVAGQTAAITLPAPAASIAGNSLPR